MTDPKSANPQGGKNIQGTTPTGKQGGLNTQQGARPNAAGQQQGGFNKGNKPTTGTGTGTGTGTSGTGTKTGGR